MTEHDQRIAIAEWMGRHAFVRSETKFNALMQPCCDVCGKMPDYYPELHLDNLPDYTRDLNAMHEAEARLPRDEQFRYRLALTLECTGYALTEFQHMAISATASQRAEALLRTLNLWRDDPTVDGPTASQCDDILGRPHYTIKP